ncbi:8057_t:CDS:2, partial [Gigaspora margarita]
IIKTAEDFRINDISLNIYIYTDMAANNNVILVPINSSSNMEFIDTIKDYDADVIYAQTGNPLNLDIYKRQDKVDKRNIVTLLFNGEEELIKGVTKIPVEIN